MRKGIIPLLLVAVALLVLVAVFSFYYFRPTAVDPRSSEQKSLLEARLEPAQAELNAPKKQNKDKKKNIASSEQDEFIELELCEEHYSSLRNAGRVIQEKRRQYLFNLFRFIRRVDRPKSEQKMAALLGLDSQEISDINLAHRYLFLSDEDQIALKRDRIRYYVWNKELESAPQIDEDRRLDLFMLANKAQLEQISTARDEGWLEPGKALNRSSILGVLLSRPNSLERDEVKQLIDEGYGVHFDTIVNAISGGKNRETLELLVDNYSGDLNQTWGHDGKELNLTLAAAQHLREDLLEYFSDLGLDQQTSVSILDALPEEPENIAAANRLAQYALDLGQQPQYLASETNIRAWASPELLAEHEAQLGAKEYFSDRMLRNAEKHKERLKAMDFAVQKALDIERRCEGHHRFTDDYFLRELDANELLSQDLSRAEKHFLFRIHEQQLLEEQNKIIELAEQNQASILDLNPLDQLGLEELYQTLVEHAGNKDTSEFIRALYELEALERQLGEQALFLGELAMSLALQRENIPLVEELLDRGYTFYPSSTFSIGAIDKVEVLIRLVELGFDPSLTFGAHNLLTKSIQESKNSELIEFLLIEGVPVKPHQSTLDALDLALQNLADFNAQLYESGHTSIVNDVKNVALLIKYETSIESSHRRYLYDLSRINPQALEASANVLPGFTIRFNDL